jgi:CBS domain containing-hemolysin-like protein
MFGLVIGALLVGFSASFFFALAESCLFSLGKWQARHLEEKSPRLGKMVNTLLAQPQDLLATIVMGNSFANACIVGLTIWVVLFEGWPMIWVLAGLAVVLLFGAEVLPKTLAVRAPEDWSLRVARPMTFLLAFSRPLRRGAQWLVNRVCPSSNTAPSPAQSSLSEGEYHELVDLAFQQGTLAASEKEIILQIISLDRRQARDVMQPRSKMSCIPDDLSMEEMTAAARRFQHRRLPMYDGTPDTIVGVLNTRALLLDPEVDLSIAIEFPSFVPATMNLLQLFKSLQRQQRGLAIVLDEFGGTAGVVTIEDIMAEVVGEFRKTTPGEDYILERIGIGRWRVSGSVRLDDFRREYPALPEVSGVETMGGLVLRQMELVPIPGEEVVFAGLKITVRSAEDRRIRELNVEILKKK